MDKNVLDTLAFIEENDIRFIKLQFTDLFGHNRSLSVSYPAFENALKGGLYFKVSEVPGFGSSSTELVLVPEPGSLLLLPFRPHPGGVARVICEVKTPEGELFKGDPRQILKEAQKKAHEQGYEFCFGAKIEFYLFEQDENGEPTTRPVDSAGYYDVSPLDKGEDTRREIILTLDEMGISVNSSHHEAGTGQHEIEIKCTDPVECADQIQTFKTVVKTIAGRNGLHATFMPKPLDTQPGSGMHVMVTAFKDGKNAFTKDGELSKTALNFAGGIFKNLPLLSAIFNPTVNSYKRLEDSFSGELTWRPGSDDAAIRAPHTQREGLLLLRTPDGAANPYLLFALMLIFGLEGIDEGADPEGIRITLPKDLDEALKLLRGADLPLPEEGLKAYISEKQKEYERYRRTVHDWELREYLKRY